VNEAKDSPVRYVRGFRVCSRRNRFVGTLPLAALLSASYLTSSAGLAQDTQSKRTDRISGTVVNNVTHEPIGHALVLSSDERFATMTDSYGRFEFIFSQAEASQGAAAGSTSIGHGAPAGFNGNDRPYALIARKPGFLTDPDNPQQNLQSIQSGTDLTIPLVPEALIVGHVALPTSEAPDSIRVEIYRRQVQNGRAHWVSAGTEFTRSNGDFRFAELSAGSYKVLTHELLDRDPQTSAPGGQMYGYAPVYFPSASDFASAAIIQLTPGKIVHVDVSLLRQPYYRIRIPVINAPNGVPLGVNVSVQGRGGPGYSLAYNLREQAITGLLPNGSYKLEAVSYGVPAVSGSLNITVHGPLEGSTLIVVPRPLLSVNVKEEFTSSGRRALVIGNGPDGYIGPRGPVRDVNVTLEPVDDFDLHRSFGLRPASDAEDNSLVVENVPPGRFWVRVYASRGYVYSMTSGGVDLLHQPLMVPAGSSIAPIEITLRDDSAYIEGTIEGANTSTGESNTATAVAPGQIVIPAAIANAHLYCVPLPDSTGSFTDVYAAGDGKFVTPPLPPGVYRLLAFSRAQPDLEYENPEAMRVYDGKGQIVRLGSGQKEHVQLQLISTSE
jgi:hypothetical protein